jgi:hypothetical protein
MEQTEVAIQTYPGTRTIPVSFLAITAIPLFISSPQLLVGSIVNGILFVSSLKMNLRQRILLSILPSLSAIAHGVIFGGATAYLIYLAPFIWIGNFALMQTIRVASVNIGNIGSTVVASMIKSFWLFGAAVLLFQFNLIPQAMVPLMGIAQLMTALIGGIGAAVIMKRK